LELKVSEGYRIPEKLFKLKGALPIFLEKLKITIYAIGLTLDSKPRMVDFHKI
jgi:hypothetical protein